MPISKRNASFRAMALALAFATTVQPARARINADALPVATLAAPTGTPTEILTGAVDEVIVDNRVTSLTGRYVALRLDDGHSVALKGPGVDVLALGARVEATGQRSGDRLFVTGYHLLPGSASALGVLPKGFPTVQTEGTLAVVHADNFDQGRSTYAWVVRGDDQRATPLQFAAMPDGLQIGMRVVVGGTMTADGVSLEANQITVLALPPPEPTDISPAPITNKVLVLLIKFPGTAEALRRARSIR